MRILWPEPLLLNHLYMEPEQVVMVLAKLGSQCPFGVAL